jgi:eukaryotic-like serine/threonine-protein kinase
VNDGKELFYLALDRTLMAVPFTLGKESIQLGTPHALFHAPVIATNVSSFDVTADGKGFLGGATGEKQSAPLSLVMNWTEELKK